MKKRLISIILIITLLMHTTAYANEAYYFSNMSQKDTNKIITGIISSIFNSDENEMYKYSMYFSSQVRDELIKYMHNNRLVNTPSQFCIDYIQPEYASTGDIVLMANVKAYSELGENTVYLFEFHINNESQIYGYQIWAY